MKNIKQTKKSPIKSTMFRTFTILIFIFTILLYVIITGLIYLQYSGEIGLIYTDGATHILISMLVGLFVLGWFFAYAIYIGVIKPIYETFNIIVESVDTLIKQDVVDKDQLIYLDEFVKNSLFQLNKSSLTNKIDISLNTESYIKKLSELIKQNEDLSNSKNELSNLVEQLEKQQKLLELEKAKTSAIIDSIPNGLLVTSRDGNIFLVNRELESILNINSENLLGKFIYNVLPGVKLINNENLDNYKSGLNNISVFNYQSEDKKKNITIENTSNPIVLNKDIFGSVYVFRDTTQEQATERAQKEFVSLASHQLRTPITSIKWNAEIIMSNQDIDKEVAMAANDIYKESHRMEKLINSLLNLSRIDLGKIKFIAQDINLSEYIESLLKTLQSEIELKNIKVEKDILLTDSIKNDPVYIDIIFSNILYNAIKYTNKNGVIKINIEKKSNKLLLIISDNGIGIPKSQQSQIFSRLFRADNAKTYQPDGNGLGLYVVKKLIELMKGNIWFESEENQGTKFFLELPIDINS
jgi:two-component system sensor histidine kinase VicK